MISSHFLSSAHCIENTNKHLLWTVTNDVSHSFLLRNLQKASPCNFCLPVCVCLTLPGLSWPPNEVQLREISDATPSRSTVQSAVCCLRQQEEFADLFMRVLWLKGLHRHWEKNLHSSRTQGCSLWAPTVVEAAGTDSALSSGLLQGQPLDTQREERQSWSGLINLCVQQEKI